MSCNFGAISFYDTTDDLPSHLFDLLPKSTHMYNTCSLKDVATLYSKICSFQYVFSLCNIRME